MNLNMRSVVNIDRFKVLLPECIPVALRLHKQILKAPLLVVRVCHPPSQCVVVHRIAEVVQTQVIYFVAVAFKQVHHFRCRNVVVLVSV